MEQKKSTNWFNILFSKIYNKYIFVLKKRRYDNYYETFNSLDIHQKLVYNTTLELIKLKDVKLYIEPKSNALYLKSDDIFCKIFWNTIEIAHGWNSENAYYYNIHLPDSIIDRLKNKFYDRAEFIRKKMENEIMQNLRKNLKNIYTHMYDENRKHL